MIYSQGIAGDQAIGCCRRRTLTQRFCPFNNLIENNPVRDFDRGKKGYKSGEDEEKEHEESELEPDGSKHFKSHLVWVDTFQ